eukprot:COSAG04_NODE_9936_length_819_cov_0.891667_1_plen_109_part_10
MAGLRGERAAVRTGSRYAAMSCWQRAASALEPDSDDCRCQRREPDSDDCRCQRRVPPSRRAAEALIVGEHQTSRNCAARADAKMVMPSKCAQHVTCRCARARLAWRVCR